MTRDFHRPQVCHFPRQLRLLYDYVVAPYESDAQLVSLPICKKSALSIIFCLKTQTFLSLEARNLQW